MSQTILITETGSLFVVDNAAAALDVPAHRPLRLPVWFTDAELTLSASGNAVAWAATPTVRLARVRAKLSAVLLDTDWVSAKAAEYIALGQAVPPSTLDALAERAQVREAAEAAKVDDLAFEAFLGYPCVGVLSAADLSLAPAVPLHCRPLA
jgi:hypothetical protein